MRKFREMIFSGGNKGFTLIELLVVIAVLGILAGIALPRISGVTDNARRSELQSAATTLRNTIEMNIAQGNVINGSGNDWPTWTGDITMEKPANISSSGFTYTAADDTYSITLGHSDLSGETIIVTNGALDTSNLN